MVLSTRVFYKLAESDNGGGRIDYQTAVGRNDAGIKGMMIVIVLSMSNGIMKTIDEVRIRPNGWMYRSGFWEFVSVACYVLSIVNLNLRTSLFSFFSSWITSLT